MDFTYKLKYSVKQKGDKIQELEQQLSQHKVQVLIQW